MDTPTEPPSLSYPQLFSFQVSYTSRSDCRNSIIPEGSKKGEWRHGILEVDFPMETFFLQDRDRIFLSQTFSSFNKHAEVNNSDDCSLSLKFNSDQWEIAAQNIAEKVCIQHLLQCIAKATSIDDVVRSGKEKGIVGLDKSIIKHGRVQRKAVNQKRLDERYLVLVPGKLFIFKNLDIKGKHVRYVTSVLGATVRRLSEEQEFQILAPGSKTMSLIPETPEDLNSWVEALGTSGHTNYAAKGSDLAMKEEERKPEKKSSKVHRVQWQSDAINQDTPLPHNESEASRPSQAQQVSTNEVAPSIQEPRHDLVAHDTLAESKAAQDINKPPQEVQYPVHPPRQGSGLAEKENREARRHCPSKNCNNKQSRAMICLENALDEMEIIVDTIRTTRSSRASRCFNIDNNRRSKTGTSPSRSSQDFDWKAKQEQSWKGKDSHLEKRRREWQELLTPATNTRRHNRVPRPEAWNDPIAQISKKWQRNTNLYRKNEFEASLNLRHSIDGIPVLDRDRDLPGLLKYTNNCRQDLAQRRKISSTEVRNSYSGVVLPSATRLSAASLRSSASLQLDPATASLLKRCSHEISDVEKNRGGGRHSQRGDPYGFLPCGAGSRQTVTQKINTQQPRTTDMDTQPCGGTTSSSSEDEEEEEEEGEELQGNKKHSGNMPETCRLGGGNWESALLDAYSGVQDGNDVSEQRHSVLRGRASTDCPSLRGGVNFDQKGSLAEGRFSFNQHNNSSNRHQNEGQQVASTRNSTQQLLGYNLSKQLYGASEESSEPSQRYSDMNGMDPEPTTPRVREGQRSDNVFNPSSSNDNSIPRAQKSSFGAVAVAEPDGTPRKYEFKEPWNEQAVFTSYGIANDLSTLQDPIYDPDFTGPQIINRRQSRITQHEMAFHVKADMRNSHENKGAQHSSIHSTMPEFLETATMPNTYRPSRNELPLNPYGEDRKSLHQGNDGVETLGQKSPIFSTVYRRQQGTEPSRQSESSGSSDSSQQAQTTSGRGSELQVSDLPELVSRLSKITATSDGRDQQGYKISQEGAAAIFDRGSPHHSDAEAYGHDFANRAHGRQSSIQSVGHEAAMDSYQGPQRSSSQPSGLRVPMNASSRTMQAGLQLQGSSLARGNESSNDDPITFKGGDRDLRWSSAGMLTPPGTQQVAGAAYNARANLSRSQEPLRDSLFPDRVSLSKSQDRPLRDPRLPSRRQSQAEDRDAMMENLESSTTAGLRRS